MEPRGRAVLAENKFFSARLDIVVSRIADMTKIQAWDGRVSDENIELAIACLQQYDKIVKLWEILYFILLLSY